MNETPKRITAAEWETRMAGVSADFRAECAHMKSIVPGGASYLFGPMEYARRGDRLLERLKYDNSLAALRLWAFLFSEKDRLFLAKENGWKIFAVMKDLGQIPVISYAVPESLTFYADELWWAPCFACRPQLLDVATSLGATEDLCFVRAALGAMKTLDYFPKPDLCIAGVGGVCDDFSAVMQLIEWQGNRVHWWEIPSRIEPSKYTKSGKYSKTPFGGVEYETGAVPFLVEQYRGIVAALEEVSGRKITDKMISENLKRFNVIRGKVSELRELVYTADRVPLPGLEMFLAEFLGIHACSEPDEVIPVLDTLLAEVRRRLEKKISPLPGDPVRVYWVSPPTDASIITLLEDLGGCVTGSEYLISHSFFKLRENIPPLEAIAENEMDDPMIGTVAERAKRIVAEARRFRAEGVLITGIFGASHCPFEEGAIADAVRAELDLPVVAFDVPFSPDGLSGQVINRVEGFVEILKERRRGRDNSGLTGECCNI
jgi:benzoyl-CoA reductase/2-hydroxyglutaryl-CoA dehydratase subunit BcrC/BadD/HgdB